MGTQKGNRKAAVRLSIGMIVKNEEKYLRQCLSALKPLREQVDCELIIADTGSTDATWEIAEEFADTLFHFTWINDFAAARNSTIEKAKGEWYMSLDGDEIFENVDELIEFFNGEERKRYRSASFVVRNYSDLEHKTGYSDFDAIRIHKMCPGLRFQYAIHETIPTQMPIKRLKSYAHHDGYAFSDPELRKRKKERNRALLNKLIAEDPEDVRAIGHLTKDFDGTESEECLEYIEKGMKAARKKIAMIKTSMFQPQQYIETYIYFFYHKKACVFNGMGDWDGIIAVCEDYFHLRKTDLASDLDMYVLWSKSLMKVERYHEALEVLKKYMAMYPAYRDGKLNTFDMFIDSVLYVSPMDYMQVLASAYECCTKTKNYTEAFQVLENLSEEKQDISKQVLYCTVYSGDYAKLAEMFEVIAANDPKHQDGYLATLEQRYQDEPSIQEKMDEALGEAVGRYPEVLYFHLCNARWSSAAGDGEIFQQELQWLLSKEISVDMQGEIFYLCLKNRAFVKEMQRLMKPDDAFEVVNAVRGHHRDYAETVAECYENGVAPGNNLKELYWTAMLLEQAVLHNEMDQENQQNLFQLYLQYAAQYVKYLYASYVFEEEEISALPGIARFVFYMELAEQQKAEKDALGYIRLVRKALEQYRVMAKPVEKLLQAFKEEQDRIKQRDEQLHSYAIKVKEKILFIANSGMKDHARQLAAEYLKINPKDTEIMQQIACC